MMKVIKNTKKISILEEKFYEMLNEAYDRGFDDCLSVMEDTLANMQSSFDVSLETLSPEEQENAKNPAPYIRFCLHVIEAMRQHRNEILEMDKSLSDTNLVKI